MMVETKSCATQVSQPCVQSCNLPAGLNALEMDKNTSVHVLSLSEYYVCSDLCDCQKQGLSDRTKKILHLSTVS